MGHPVISLAFTKGKRDGDHENGNVSKQGWKEGGGERVMTMRTFA